MHGRRWWLLLAGGLAAQVVYAVFPCDYKQPHAQQRLVPTCSVEKSACLAVVCSALSTFCSVGPGTAASTPGWLCAAMRRLVMAATLLG